MEQVRYPKSQARFSNTANASESQESDATSHQQVRDF
jgi:hypothetical protein